MSYCLLRRDDGEWFMDRASWQLDQCFCDVCPAKLADPYRDRVFQSVTPGNHPCRNQSGEALTPGSGQYSLERGRPASA